MNRLLTTVIVIPLVATVLPALTHAQTDDGEEGRVPTVVPMQTLTRPLAGDASAPAAAPSSPAPVYDQPQQLNRPAPTAEDIAAMERSNEIMRQKQAARQAQMQADSMNPQTREAWDRWSGDAYPNTDIGKAQKKRDFLNLQRDWNQVQAEAHKGNISPDDNSRFLREHSTDMQRRMQAAGAEHGLDVKLQEPSGPQKTYSDVDGHGYPKGAKEAGWKPGEVGDLTPEQFSEARQTFKDQFNADLEAAKLAPVDNPAQAMRTDLMPITNDAGCFSGVECIINPDGGVMYQDPSAVRQEVDNRVNNPDGSTRGDVSGSAQKADYLNEQVRQQRAHVTETDHFIKEGNRLINDPKSTPDDVRRGQRMLEQAQGEGSSLIGKYEERGNRTVNQAANQAGTDGLDVSGKRQAAIDAVGDTRDVTVTQESADIIATNENAIRRQQTEGARVFAEGGNLSDAAEMGRNADSPSARGEIVEAVRDGSYTRHQERIRNANPDWSQADIDAAARAAANKDASRVAQEMRTQKPDVPDPKNNRWDINENPNRGFADADATASSAGQQAADARAAQEARRARAAAGGADNALSAGAQARRTINQASGMVDAAAFGGQLGDAAVRQAGKAVDENRDLGAADLGEAALEASGAAGMYALGNKISREEMIRVQKGEITPQQAMDNIKWRMAQEIGNAMVTDPINRAIEEEWKAAEREGREPSYASAAGAAAVEIGGNMTGITQIADAAMDPGSWEARAEAAAQAEVLDQYLSNSATQTDTRIGRLQSELENLSLSGDLSDPAVQAAIRDKTQALREANERMARIRESANRNAGDLSSDTVSRINAQARSQTRPDDMEDYVQQNIRDRGGLEDDAQPGTGDELADAFAAAGDGGDGDWSPVTDGVNERFADAFSNADASSQAGSDGWRTVSSSADRVASTSVDEVWAEDRAQRAENDALLREGARVAQAAEEAALADTWRTVDQNQQTQDQRGQQTLTNAQQQGQAAVAAANAQPDPRMSASDFADQMGQLQDEADTLSQERDQILSGGGNAQNGPLDPNKGGQYGGAAIAAAQRGDETGFDQRQASCNDVVKSGGNNPASITISGAGFGGSASLSWDHYGVKDRIAVLSGGSVLFDSGCVRNEGGAPLNVGAGQVKVIVEPNCEQTTNSAWEFTVACNSAVAQQ